MSLNIFAWLSDITTQLPDNEPSPFDIFNRLRRSSNDNDDDGVRAARIEYERLASTYGIPWLGVFGRHWELQYRLLTRREGETSVPDAVRAFELSHRDETIDCPQSMCSVQDLCIAYSNVDGPGYSDQTVEAAKDALDRIDTTWPCWDCLSNELVGGLSHRGDFAEAAAKCSEIEVEIRSTGVNPSTNYATTRLRALINNDDVDAATAFDAQLVRDRYNPHTAESWPLYDLTRGRMLLRRGDIAEAVQTLRDSLDPLEKPRFGDEWRALAMDLLRGGHIDNDDNLGATLVRLGTHYHSVGAWRRAFDTFVDAAIAAAMRGAMGSARRAHGACESIVSDLAQPLNAPERLIDVETAIAAAPSEVAQTAPLDNQVESLEADLDTGFDVDNYLKLSQLLMSQGWDDVAISGLWKHVRENPDDERAALTLMSLLLSSSGTLRVDELTELAELLQPIDAGLENWVRANTHAAAKEWNECAERCAEVVRYSPDAKNTRRLWASALGEQEKYDDAAIKWHEILELPEAEETPVEVADERLRSDSWAAIIAGSLAGDWPLVRKAGARLGMEFASESGPIEENYEAIVVNYPAERQGGRSNLIAQRTGPVTATIIQSSAGNRQRYYDRVVFNPARLNELPPDASDAERAHFLYHYDIIDTVEKAGYSGYMIEGAIPGDDGSKWEQLRETLQSEGVGVWIYSAGKDHFRATESSEDVFLFSAAIPATMPATKLHDLLTAATASWEHRPAWPGLATAAGVDVDLHQDRLANMWGFDE